MELVNFIENFKNQLEDIEVEITANTNYVHAEFWDSLTSMVVKVMIEDEYGVDIPVEKLNDFKSIQELFDFIKANS